ncbi:DUF6350 family protein [Nocardioides sp. AE5]|uniref:cell division protein PerM n=1 Tax=Nocardioides sp. AE5 TaxID=2962573 RepID=UPI0028811F51|nr:DUF6350 family protein [Nocardioides sp. AE5]MDT0201993.1 DUF6350 family protein [Nocardioides sp. AE5]
MTATLDASGTGTAAAQGRPVPLLALAAGACAAGATLVACLVVATVGWFLADGGAHGAPRDALRTGGAVWLMAHGSGVEVRGVAITAMPLGLSLLCAFSAWRFGLRLGEQVAGHGPDALDLADGERDWTVPLALGPFAAAYVLIGVVTSVLVGVDVALPRAGAVLLWCVALSGGLGAVAIAVGSGRAAIWLPTVPRTVREGAVAAVHVLRTFLLLSLATFAVALVLDFGTAMSLMSQLHLGTGDAIIVVLVMVLLLPNAVLFAGSYLAGPGFTVGTGTLVSPSLVAIGPLPMFPMLAALPDNGPTPAWAPALMLLPVLVAGYAVARSQARNPVVRWDEGALQGLVAGVLAGLVIGGLAALAGGAVGPGRMAEVGPLAGTVALRAMIALGLGAMLGGLYATWRNRRMLPVEDSGPGDPDTAPST